MFYALTPSLRWPSKPWNCALTGLAVNGRPRPIFITEQSMSFNRLLGIPRRELSVSTLVSAGQSSRPSFVVWPLATMQGTWQEIYRIAQEKTLAVMLPEPTVRFECWN
jgi:hypothetical protein